MLQSVFKECVAKCLLQNSCCKVHIANLQSVCYKVHVVKYPLQSVFCKVCFTKYMLHIECCKVHVAKLCVRKFHFQASQNIILIEMLFYLVEIFLILHILLNRPPLPIL